MSIQLKAIIDLLPLLIGFVCIVFSLVAVVDCEIDPDDICDKSKCDGCPFPPCVGCEANKMNKGV